MTLVAEPTGPFPERLSQLGIFIDLDDPSRLAEQAHEYAPQYPLWSNGSKKHRQLVLPDAQVVDDSTSNWDFPVGTLFFKTFSFDDEGSGSADSLRHVETRVMRRSEAQWEFAAYLWDDDRSDGALLDGERATKVEVSLDGQSIVHEVPSERQCRTCHESSEVRVLGFSELQLNDADVGSTLERLDSEGVFEVGASSQPEVIEAEDDETAWLLGYAAGNCTHCHNGFGEANSSFDLRHPVFVDNTVDRETEHSGSGLGLRIAPGAPEDSVLYLGFIGEDNGTGIAEMPPLGVQKRDESAAERMRAWIEALQ